MPPGASLSGGDPINLYYFDYADELDRIQSKALQKQYAEVLLRRVIFAETGRDCLELTRVIAAHGKPSFKEIELKFNLSNTRGMVAVATAGGEVGVDCEKVRAFSPRTARLVCSEEELLSIKEDQDFFRLWTFKEAFVKMLGSGFRYPFKNVTLFGEKSVIFAFPSLKIFQTSIGEHILCAAETLEEGASSEINLHRVDLLS